MEPSDVAIEFQVDDTPQPDLQLAAAQSEQRFRAALPQLFAEQMRVVELSFFEEKAHAEIAETLGYSARYREIQASPGDDQASQTAE